MKTRRRPGSPGSSSSPSNPIVQQIGLRQQIRVLATYTDGEVRDVSREAFIESGNTEVVSANKSGLMTSLRRGEAPLLARFEGAYAATTLTVMGDRKPGSPGSSRPPMAGSMSWWPSQVAADEDQAIEPLHRRRVPPSGLPGPHRSAPDRR